MPDVAQTICVVTGPAKDIARFKRKHIVEETDPVRIREAEQDGVGAPFDTFDFRTVIPEPEDDTGNWELSPGWYDANWGTGRSWDFCWGMDEPEKIGFEFCTAWTFPRGIFEKLSAMYPTLRFEGAWIVPSNEAGTFSYGRAAHLRLVSAPASMPSR